MISISKKQFILAILILALNLGLAGCFHQPEVNEDVDVNANTNQDITTVEDDPKMAEKAILDKYYPGRDDVYIGAQKVEDGFAIGFAKFKSGGGYEWYAKKQNEGWVVFLKTQENPFCSILRENEVPDSFYTGECWLEGGRSEVSYSNYK
jgi:hypothetical protein